MRMSPAGLFILITLTLGSFASGQSGPVADEQQASGKSWPLHVIDNSSRGADGVRLADVNRDGLMDITTGWEEGGITRVYLHPGNDAAAQLWPAVTVGRTPNVEDAVFVDLDADGHTDVVSCCEGGTRTMFVHWAPGDPKEYPNPEAWTTEPIAASQDAMMWMFCLPMQVDGLGGIDLVAGAKGNGAKIGWFEAPEDPRRLDQWTWHPICDAGWIMSLRADDVDTDGDLDVVATDRRGELRGCRWLENPDPGIDQKRPWTNHFVGGRDHEVMFMAIADLDTDGTDDMLVAARPEHLLLFRRQPGNPPSWEPTMLQLPKNTGGSKGVAIGRIDGDGQPDIVFSCEGASGTKSGVMWLSHDKSPTDETWTAHALSGPAGIKFDRLELLDIDGDGDLDVLTCEESEPVDGKRRGLGVFWYENPTKW